MFPFLLYNIINASAFDPWKQDDIKTTDLKKPSLMSLVKPIDDLFLAYTHG